MYLAGINFSGFAQSLVLNYLKMCDEFTGAGPSFSENGAIH